MLTFSQFISEAAHPIPPLKDWQKYNAGNDKHSYYFTPKNQGDRGHYDQHHYEIQPQHDYDTGTSKGYAVYHKDPLKPYSAPGRRGDSLIPYDTKNLGIFSNLADAHRAVKDHHDGGTGTASVRKVKRPEGHTLFDTNRMQTDDQDFGFLHAKNGKSIRDANVDTHGHLWAKKTEGKRAIGTIAHIFDALSQGHVRYRFKPDSDKRGHVEANFTIHHNGDEADLQHRKNHIGHMLAHAPYPISHVNIDVHKHQNFDHPHQSKSFDNQKHAQNWLAGKHEVTEARDINESASKSEWGFLRPSKPSLKRVGVSGTGGSSHNTLAMKNGLDNQYVAMDKGNVRYFHHAKGDWHPYAGFFPDSRAGYEFKDSPEARKAVIDHLKRSGHMRHVTLDIHHGPTASYKHVKGYKFNNSGDAIKHLEEN
ncbi:unnamed protein product [Sphagnum tenellum]